MAIKKGKDKKGAELKSYFIHQAREKSGREYNPREIDSKEGRKTFYRIP